MHKNCIASGTMVLLPEDWLDGITMFIGFIVLTDGVNDQSTKEFTST